MKVIKKWLVFAVILLIYVFSVSLLLQQFYAYRMAYYSLSRLISHPTVEVLEPEEEGG